MNPSSSAPLRAVVVSGITVNLPECLERSVCIKFHMDGNAYPEILLERGTNHIGIVPLPTTLFIQDDKSTLTVDIQEKDRVLKFKDRSLAQLNLTLDDILIYLESPACKDPKKYPLRLSDSKKKLWLNVAVVSSISQMGSSSGGDQTLQTPPRVLDKQGANVLNEAIQSLEKFKTAFERLGGARLEKGRKVVEAFGELHSTAEVVIRLVKHVHDELKVHDQYHQEMCELAESIEKTLQFIPAAEEVDKLNALKDKISPFYELINKTVDFIEKRVADGGISKILDSESEIESLKEQYQAFEKVFNLEVVIDDAVGMDDVAKSQDLQELEVRLGGIKEVHPRADPCMEGTRVSILSEVASKIYDLGGKNVIWVRGAPGSGKSAVSLTMKSRLQERGRLVTYFRFDRNDATVTTSKALWCHVAYDLAKRYPSVLKHNLSLLRENKVDFTSSTDIFKSLVEEPLSNLTDPPPNHPLVIVIDALDECGGNEGPSSLDRKALLKTIETWPKLPNQFKLLVTSREESDIARCLSSTCAGIEIRSGYSLMENPHANTSIETSRNILIFLESRFQSIRERFPSLPMDWPGPDTVTNMVHRATGNFMWATTAANFVGIGIDPGVRLRKIMGDGFDTSSMSPLYALYSAILDISFGYLGADDPEAEVLRSVLGIMVFAQRPLNDVEYTKLQTTEVVTQDMIDSIREGLRSVISPGPLQFIHKSFDDFLLSEDACPPNFAIRRAGTQFLLAKLSVTAMAAGLRFNMCSLETSSLKNVDVPDIETKIRDGISPLLSYSCRFWAHHLSLTPASEELLDAVKKIIFDKILYWFEAMSLLNEINQVSYSLTSVLNWVKPASDGKLEHFIRDARQFINAFIHPITESAPHIYISALAFAPERFPIARQFLSQFSRIPEVSVGKPTEWSPCIFISEHGTDSICSVAFSPDAKYYVTGADNGTIRVCGSEAGNLIAGPFWDIARHFGDMLMSCSFDPDGEHVWAHYLNGQVIGWDVVTGNKCIDFQAGEQWSSKGIDDVIGCCSQSGQHIVSVTRRGAVTLWSANTGERLREVFEPHSEDKDPRVSFSLDGCYMAWARRNETTLKIWELEGGSNIRGQLHPPPQYQHTKGISALSFSGGGYFVVSGSYDGTILIWDAKTGDVVGPPLATGKGPVSAVGYSHENLLLLSASGSPGTLMVWNASTQEAVLGPLEGHESWITGIVLSRDGRRALSASKDSTVRMWDLDAVQTTRAIEGHVGSIRCIAFSPCGKKLASLGDDRTILVWDIDMGKRLLDPIDTLPHYHKLIFSPDGSQIAAFGTGLRVWNAYTGELAFEYSANQRTRIDHVAFRSTDQLLVTCFVGGIIRIWSLKDGSLTEDLSASSPRPEDPRKPLEIVALSPNGSTAVVRDDPRHYLWSTTTCRPLPLTFTDNECISGHQSTYSPSGSFFVAASNDDILRVWNAQTGELVAKLDGCMGCLAFSPDDCHIAFSYADNTDQTVIWIGNARTGRIASRPWKAHTDRITSLTFSPDGETLASGSDCGQIGIWNTADLLGHSSVSTGFLGVGTCMRDGWVTDVDGKLLFWVPKDHRSALVWSQNIGRVIGGRGVRTELDLTRFRYGLDWEECFSGGEQTGN